MSEVSYSISLVICKCNIAANTDSIIQEEIDKDKYIPDGRRVVYVKSNFVTLYHANFPKQEVKVKSSNKGRKSNPKKIKKNRSKGSGEQFNSSIAFGVLYENIIYNIIVFRKNYANISGLNDDNIDKTRAIINILMDFMNETDPTLNVHIVGDPVINLCNIKSEILPTTDKVEVVESDVRVQYNLHLLGKLLRETTNEYWRCEKFVVSYNNTNSYLSMNFKFNGQNYGTKIYYNGKLNIFGGKDKDICVSLLREFHHILTTNKHLSQYSIPARLKNKIIYH